MALAPPRRRVPARPASAPATLLLLLLAAAVSTACGQLALDAVDQADVLEVDVEVVREIEAPDGWRAVLIAEGLTYPSAMTFDDEGRLYVLESRTVPVPGFEPRIFRISTRGIEPVEVGGDDAPSGEQAVGLTFHDGWLYFSHEQADGSWAVSRVRPEGGDAEAVVRGFPPLGDHWINHLEFGPDGDLYFGVGSATNSGVVASSDPVNQKWLADRPATADIPCATITLTRHGFVDDDATTDEEGDTATTGAYQAYGESGARRVPGSPLCTGAIFRQRAGGGTPVLVAWGFRNPVALATTADGDLLVGMHGADIRGTRPILDDPDAIYRVRPGAWYGWPDYGADLVPVTDRSHQPPREYLATGEERIEPVIDLGASDLSAPDRSLLLATTAPHAALGGMVVVPAGGPLDRWAGQLLLSEMGDFRPVTDPSQPDLRAGFQIELVDLATGRRETFARNRGEGPPQPSSTLDLENGFERPVDVEIGPEGLPYVLDFGVLQFEEGAQKGLPKTGKVFRIEPRSHRR